MHSTAKLSAAMAALIVAACATSPDFDTTDIDTSITPQEAAQNIDALKGSRLIWGGILVSSANLDNDTQFEILAFPLNSHQKPETEQKPQGRFLARQPGYIELSDYEQGRLLTVTGQLQETHPGRVGQAEYTYPVVEVDEIFLWPSRGQRTETRFHFGLGVMFQN